MIAWKYHFGEWTEIEDPLLWNEGEEWGTTLQRAGYRDYPQFTLGGQFSSIIAQLYLKKDDEPPYLITFGISDTVENVYIDSLPSLMYWLREYGPFYSLIQIAETQDDLLTLFGRAFRAWHGHDYNDVCLRCAPNQFKQLQELRQKLMERQKKAPLQKQG